MNENEKDRQEIIRHWNRLNLFYRIIVLFIFTIINHKTTESIVYLLNRLYVRPDHMVNVYRTEEISFWDSIRNYLVRKLFSRP